MLEGVGRAPAGGHILEVISLYPKPLVKGIPMKPQASLVQIRDYFGMTSKQISDEWKVLNEDEKNFFKDGVAEVLGL